jgi:hypothetical protein
MNRASQPPLGGFEQRLLRELRQVIAEGPRLPPEPERPAAARKPFGRRLPLALAGGAAGAIAIALAGALLLGGGQPSKAWAVDRNPNGTVTVRIDSLSDAAGLQRKLNEAGVPALVQYLPRGKTCAGGELQPPHPPPGAVAQSSGGAGSGPVTRSGSDSRGPVTESSGKPPAGEVREAPPASEKARQVAGDRSVLGNMIAVKQLPDGGVEFTVSAHQSAGRTLVIRNQSLAPGQAPAGAAPGAPAQGSAAEGSATAGGSAINVTFVEGKAEPCKVVDSPAQ